MRRDDVGFVSAGSAISATLFLPDPAPSSSVPAIVVCNGFAGTKADKEPVARPFADTGYAVLTFDYRGWGESEGEPGAVVPLEQVDDIRNALSFLETRPDVAADRMGLFGISFGGGNATYAAAVDRRVAAAVSFSGVGDGESWLRGMRTEWEWRGYVDDLYEDRRRRVAGGSGRRVDPFEEIMVSTPERRAVRGSAGGGIASPLSSGEAIAEFRPYEVARRISPRAILWMCVAGDVVVPATHSRRMYARAGSPKKLVVLPGDTHYRAYETYAPQIEAHALDWFDRYLPSGGRVEIERDGVPCPREEDQV